MSRPNVLVIEDDPGLQALVARTLEQNDIECRVVSDLASAERFVAEDVPSLIVTDRALPDGDGLEWLLRMRQAHPEVEAILMTSDELDPQSSQLIERSISDLLPKPFDQNELLRRVQRLLKRRKTTTTARPVRATGALTRPDADEVDEGGLYERVRIASSLCGRIAHTLKNPIASAKLMVEMLRATPPREDGLIAVKPEDIEFLSRQIFDLDRLAAEVGWFGREAPSLPQTVDLGSVVKRACVVIEGLARERSVKVQAVEIKGHVVGDAGAIERLLIRVLQNAVEASDAGQSIHVSCRHDGPELEIEIRDQGVGMHHDTRLQSFEPFFTTRTRHLGLGLTACWRDLRRLGGHVSLHSSPGEGTRVQIRMVAAKVGP